MLSIRPAATVRAITADIQPTGTAMAIPADMSGRLSWDSVIEVDGGMVGVAGGEDVVGVVVMVGEGTVGGTRFGQVLIRSGGDETM